MAQDGDKLEVVASSESKYFQAMDDDVLADCVLVREGKSVYAIPVDQGWVDPDYGRCPGGSDDSAAETNIQINSAYNLADNISKAGYTYGIDDAVQFDFAESAQMGNTSFAAMGSANESRILTNSQYSETYSEAGTIPLNVLCNHSRPSDNEYLEITGKEGDADEYLDVTGGNGGDNDFLSVFAALKTVPTATIADADADEYLEVTGGDDGDNDYFSVLVALKTVPTATVVDADEYLEVNGDQSTEEEDDDNGHAHDSGATAEAKPRRVRKAVWAPSGQLRAPKTMFVKRAVWKSGKKKVVAVNQAANAFKKHGKFENGKDTTSKDEPLPVPTPYVSGESIVDDKAHQQATSTNAPFQ